MNLTIDTSRTTLAGINHHDNNSNSLRPPSPVPAPAPAQNRFPLSSPITEEIPSPKDSGTSSSQKSGKPVPKLVNANLDGGAAGGEWKDRDLNANSALSSTEVQRAIYARFLEQSTNSRLEARRNMSTTTTTRGSNAVEDVLKAQNRKSGGIVKRSYQQRPAGLQVLHGFSSDDNDDHDHEDEDEKGHSFLDLSDLKSIAKAREQERARENTRHDDYASSQSSEEPLPSRTSELSLSDRPIMIGLKVPYESTPHAATAGDTVDSASSRTPVTPSIMITPAKENPPWHIDMDMDMSTSPQMLHRPRVASSVYSQPSPRMMHDEDAPPVPAIPALHSGTSLHDNMHQRPVSVGTEFDVDEISTKEKGLSPTEDTNTNTSRKNMKKKLLHRLSVNTSAANRPDSQGWWTYLLSPLLSRSNTVSSRRTGFSPQQQTRSARSPLSAVSSPPQPTTAAEGGGEEESSVHWWDDEKQVVIPTEKSHFSPDTPEDMTRHVPPFAGGGVWDMPFSDNHTTTIVPRTIVEGKSEKTRSVFQTGNAVVPNYELHGSAAEYYQASAHDLYHKEDPYFECVNHVCSMTSAKRRAEIEAEEKELEELAAAAAAENEKRGLAVFIFDPSRNKNDPFIAFVEKGTADVKEVVVDEDAAESEKEGEGDGEKKEVGEDVEKPGLSNARDLLSFDSSDEDEDPKSAEEKGHTASRSLHESPDLVATSRSAASFSPPTSTRYEPSVSVPMQAKESKGVGAPPLPPVSYAREMTLPPAPAPAPAPVPLASAPVIYPREMTPPAPAPVQMPFMPPPQPRAFSPEPVPMPMMPPPQPRAFSPEPVPMPMPPPAPIPAPAPPQEPIPMPMSRSPPVNERAPVAMQSPPMPPPSNDTGRGHGIPSGYQWEPVPIPRAMSPPRPARAPSPPMPQPTAAPVFRSAEIVESTTRPEPEPERDAEPVPIPRSAPSFHRPGPFSAQRSDPQPPAPAPPQQSSHHTIDDPESELPPYSAADQSSRNAPRFQPSFLPTYSSRSQSEQHDQNAVAPAPISPGLQQAMTSRGGIPMSDVNQRGTRDVDYNDANSIFRTDEHRTIINVHNYYNGEHPRDAPEPPRPGMQFVSEADLRAREENEARRQRLEKEDNFAKKVGGLWRGRGCISDKGCFGRSGREGRTRRRWYAAIIAFCMLVIILSISLATTLTRKGDPTPVESEWLNITGFPPIPTGIMTVAGPAPAVERSSCIAPTQAWSCALPPEQQSSQAGGYAADFPNFRIEIRFRNNSVSANNTAINSTATRRMFDRRGTWDASPAVPRLEDQIFLGNTTDNITTPFQGEDTPFYITFLSPFDVSNTTVNKFKRDDVSSSTGTETGTAAPTSATTATQATTTGTATSTVVSNTATSAGTGTSTATSTSSSSFNVNSIIPAPDLASDGTAAAATLYPLPIQQPIKLYNRGLPTEHYGFFTYFDKSIFLASNATITGGTTDTDSRDTNGGSAETEASVRCTWSQTRFLVQIWTQPQNVTHMTLTASSNTTGTSSNTSSTASATASPKSSSSSSTTSSANNFTSPGSFPYPITITIDRHGGLATQKLAYCYGIDQHTSSSSPNTVTGTYYNLTNPKLQAEQRESGGTIVQPSPDYFVLAGAIAQGVTADQIAPVDGGTGGCMCQWRNWIEIH